MTSSSFKRIPGLAVAGMLAAVCPSTATFGQEQGPSATWQPDQWFSADEKHVPSQVRDPFSRDGADMTTAEGREMASADKGEGLGAERIADAIRKTEELMAQQTEIDVQAPTEGVDFAATPDEPIPSVTGTPASEPLLRDPDDAQTEEQQVAATAEPAIIEPKFTFAKNLTDIELNIVVGDISWGVDYQPLPINAFDLQTAEDWLALPWSTHRFQPPKGKYVDGFWIREVPATPKAKPRKKNNMASRPPTPPSRPIEITIEPERNSFWDLFRPRTRELTPAEAAARDF